MISKQERPAHQIFPPQRLGWHFSHAHPMEMLQQKDQDMEHKMEMPVGMLTQERPRSWPRPHEPRRHHIKVIPLFGKGLIKGVVPRSGKEF